MFDRLDTDESRVADREESARSLAAARKSVFDRLRGMQVKEAVCHPQRSFSRTLPGVRGGAVSLGLLACTCRQQAACCTIKCPARRIDR